MPPRVPAWIRERLAGQARARNLKLLRRCESDSIQAAVDAAVNHDRIYLLPERQHRRRRERRGYVRPSRGAVVRGTSDIRDR